MTRAQWTGFHARYLAGNLTAHVITHFVWSQPIIIDLIRNRNRNKNDTYVRFGSTVQLRVWKGVLRRLSGRGIKRQHAFESLPLVHRFYK